MNRYRAGAVAWMASAVLFPVQLLVALRWPQGYSMTDNAISDLGVTICGQFSEQGKQVRDVCSPWHPLFNAGMVASGVLIMIGAVLLHGWWDSRAGRAGTILMALTGLLVAIVGLAPWDTHPDVHDGAALGQAVAQWLAMGLLAMVAGPGHFRRLTIVALVVSLVGFAAFVAALEGTEVPWLGFGGTERLSFDILSIWTVLVGATLLMGRGLRDQAPRLLNGLRSEHEERDAHRSRSGIGLRNTSQRSPTSIAREWRPPRNVDRTPPLNGESYR